MNNCYEYIWIDGYGTLRSKTRVLKEHIRKSECLPKWNYDGSSTNQAEGSDSEIILHPVNMFPDPFRARPLRPQKGRTARYNYLVLCETYLPSGEATESNKRHSAKKVFDTYAELEPMYGIEQEFFISKHQNVISFLPLGYQPLPQKDYYCGIGGSNVYGRTVIEEAFQNCIKANLNLTGLNAEVAPAQWEFQVCAIGIEAADQLVMLRYITQRTLELYDYDMDISPKPVTGDWNGSGCHVNYSTKLMREEGGIKHIMDAIHKLETHHTKCIKNYGTGNELRLTGLHETSSMDKFSYGIANRGASVRIPRDTEKNKCGYFEDRRPSSNMDPYVVTSLILDCSN